MPIFMIHYLKLNVTYVVSSSPSVSGHRHYTVHRRLIHISLSNQLHLVDSVNSW